MSTFKYQARLPDGRHRRDYRGGRARRRAAGLGRTRRRDAPARAVPWCGHRTWPRLVVPEPASRPGPGGRDPDPVRHGLSVGAYSQKRSNIARQSENPVLRQIMLTVAADVEAARLSGA